MLPERLEPVGHRVAPRGGEVVGCVADLERDMVEPGHALGLRPRTRRACELARQIVVTRAGGEEDDATVLAGTGFREAEQVAIEASRRLEVADEERDVTERADFHRA